MNCKLNKKKCIPVIWLLICIAEAVERDAGALQLGWLMSAMSCWMRPPAALSVTVAEDTCRICENNLRTPFSRCAAPLAREGQLIPAQTGRCGRESWGHSTGTATSLGLKERGEAICKSSLVANS